MRRPGRVPGRSPLASPSAGRGAPVREDPSAASSTDGLSLLRRAAGVLAADASGGGRIATASRTLQSGLLALDGLRDGEADDARLHVQQALELAFDVFRGKRAR
jgi:hypothetical protein